MGEGARRRQNAPRRAEGKRLMAGLPSSQSERRWARTELVTARMALSEFRNEYGPGREDLAERIDHVLRTGRGDTFVVVDLETIRDLASGWRANDDEEISNALVEIERAAGLTEQGDG